MKKYNVVIGCEYVQGHLRYGHLEGVIEATSEEEAKAIALAEHDYFDLIVDDYSVDDYEIDERDIEVTQACEDSHEQ